MGGAAAFGAFGWERVRRGAVLAAREVDVGPPWGSRRPPGRLDPVSDGMSLPPLICCPTAVTPGDVILVVERGVLDHHAAHVTGRRRATGDSAPVRPTWMSMPEARSRPARRGICAPAPSGGRGAEAEAGLEGKVVHLVDDAVDVIAQSRPLRLDPAVMGKHLLWPGAEDRQRIGLESKRLERWIASNWSRRAVRSDPPRHRRRSGAAGQRVMRASSWRSDPAAALRGLAKVLSPPAACRSFRAAKIGVGTCRLAPHLKHIGRAGQALGNVGDGLCVLGDVLADLAVAAGGRLDRHAILIAERQGQPIDLRLGRIADFAGKPRKRRTRSSNSATSSAAKAFSSDSIRTRCGTLPNPSATAAHLVAGRIRTLQPGNRASISALRRFRAS